MEKILDIIEGIAYEKGLPLEHVTDAIKEAIIKVAKETIDEKLQYDAEIDKKNKTLHLYQVITVCTDEEPINEDEKSFYITLSEAKKQYDEEIKIGDELRYELSLENMSRSAVNALFKELEFKIQRLVENQLFEKYKAQIGKIISGTVIRIDKLGNTFIEIDEIRAILPKKNRIKGEEFSVGNIVGAILKYIGIDKHNGIQIELSRTTPKMLEELLKLEVPEIKDGEVEIIHCARIPGERAKIALQTHSSKIDPVGAAVGVKGVRINAVSKELKNENIDCIEYAQQPEIYIARALSPALVMSVTITEEKKAIVNITPEQRPKAIGKNGINIRLASMLTGYQIELKEVAHAPINLDEDKENQKMGLDALSALFKQS